MFPMVGSLVHEANAKATINKMAQVEKSLLNLNFIIIEYLLPSPR
jgi:hypothetical protein